MEKEFDFVAIGDVTTDAFIRLHDASVHCDVNKENCQICMDFAAKVPYESVEVVRGVGNSPNAATAAARLGLHSLLVSNIGDDQNGSECLSTLQKEKVETKYVTIEKGKETNYHYVLWYEDERTILVKHQAFNYHLPKLPKTKWLYLSSLGKASLPYHREIIDWLDKNPETKLLYQPGTFQIELGFEKLPELFKRAEVFVCNMEEAKKILQKDAPIQNLLENIRALGPKIVLITDGPKGACMRYDADNYFMPIYPDPKPPYERTGCGDSFASTFASALIFGTTPLDALLWAPINPMSVVQYVGAQKGLLTKEQLEKLLTEKPPHYKTQKI